MEQKTTTGKITLFDYDHREMFWCRYNSLARRAEILSTWKQLYGNKFQTMYYQIQPVVPVRHHEARPDADIIFNLAKEGHSNAKVGELVGMTGQGVGYVLRKWA